MLDVGAPAVRDMRDGSPGCVGAAAANCVLSGASSPGYHVHGENKRLMYVHKLHEMLSEMLVQMLDV